MQKRASFDAELRYMHFQLPALFPLVGLLGEDFNVAPPKGDQHLGYHFHNCYEWGVCHEGKGLLVVGERSFPFVSHDVLIVPPGMLHYVYGEQECRFNWFYLDPTQLLEELKKPGTNARLTAGVVGDPKLYGLMDYLIDELMGCWEGSPFAARGLVQAALALMIRALSEDSIPPDGVNLARYAVVAPALEYMEQHLAEPLSIGALAECSHVSEPHFRRVFKRLMGCTPLSYLNRMRVQKACVLLHGSAASLADVAQEAGFSSLGHFTRTFTETMGMPPSAWRADGAYTMKESLPRYFCQEELDRSRREQRRKRRER